MSKPEKSPDWVDLLLLAVIFATLGAAMVLAGMSVVEFVKDSLHKY